MSGGVDRYRSSAESYDKSSEEMGWYAPNVLFGLMYRHIREGETLLDIGIGTGLASVLFHKAGLVINGIDSSKSMLEQCRQRNMASRLVEHDLGQSPWPLETGSFDHAVSTGVTHLLGELEIMVAETARLIRPGGTLGFDFSEYETGSGGDYQPAHPGVYMRMDEEYGVAVYRHTAEYVFDLLRGAGFELLCDTDFLVSREDRRFFRAVVSRRR